MSDSLQPHGPYSPWNSPVRNTALSSLSLLQGNLPNPGIKPRSPILQVDSLPAEPQYKPHPKSSVSLITQVYNVQLLYFYKHMFSENASLNTA